MQEQEIDRAVTVLRRGGLVVLPTETWYALAARADHAGAVNRVFAAKGRPSDKPLLLLIDHPDRLAGLIRSMPPFYPALIRRFWPGPLTLVFPAAPQVDPQILGPDGTVAIRCTSHPVTGQVIRKLGLPVTGTSANRSGAPPHSTPQGVEKVLGKEVDMVLDAGSCPGHLASTIVSVRNGELICLREGQVPFARVRQATASVREPLEPER